MDKKNYWVIALMVALAVGLLAAVTLLRPSGGQNGEIVVTVDGAEYARVPLGQKQTLTVTQEDGSVNVVEISERGAVMDAVRSRQAAKPRRHPPPRPPRLTRQKKQRAWVSTSTQL